MCRSITNPQPCRKLLLGEMFAMGWGGHGPASTWLLILPMSLSLEEEAMGAPFRLAKPNIPHPG